MGKMNGKGMPIPGRGFGLLGQPAALAFLLGLAAGLPLWGQSQPRTEAQPISTGPEVGKKIPLFRAPDQNGKMQDFSSIRGPKGAVIFFNRSADW